MFGKSSLGNICYYIADVDRTEAFYRDVIGLEVQRMEDDGSGNAWLMATTANGITLLFFKMDTTPGNSPIIVFELPEGGIDDVVAGLSEQGVTIVTPVSHAPGGWSSEFLDPDGHTISTYQSEDLPRQLG